MSVQKRRLRFSFKISKYKLTFEDKRYHNLCSCSCKYFLKHAICMHLVGYSNINGLNLFGDKYSKPDTRINFVHKTKKGRKPGRKLAEKALVRE